MAGWRPMAERKRNSKRACGFAKENYRDAGEKEVVMAALRYCSRGFTSYLTDKSILHF